MSKPSSATPVIAAIGVGVVLLALNLLFAPERPTAPPPPAAPEPPTAPGAPSTPGSEPGAEAPAPPSAPSAPDRSRAVPLPRPEPSVEAPRSDDAPPEAREPAPDGRSGVVEAEDIQDAMLDVTPGIRECMQGWWDLDPELEGRVVMDFTLTPEGLGEVLVLEHDDVPFGVQTCFATAIYEADWPTPAEGELQVTYPFVFTSEDAPPEAADSGA